MKLILTLLYLFSFAVTAVAAPGDFDQTFGFGGAAESGTSYNFYFEGSANEDPPHCCILGQQADGKLLVAGATDESPRRLVLRRFNTNGTLDTSYGFQGEALGTFVYPGSFVYGVPTSLKTLSNGNTIVAGYATGSGGVKRLVVWRFTSTGVLDITFGNGGIVTRSYSSHIVATGVAEYRGTIYAAASIGRLYCINSDGSACHGFGGIPGFVNVPGINRVAIQPGTNRLLASGYGWVKRYSLSGQLDSSFGNGGTAGTCAPSCGMWCTTKTEMAVAGNGKIATAATLIEGSIGNSHFYTLGYLNSDGSANTAFGGNGCYGDESPYPPFATPGTQRGLEIQSDGKLLILEGPADPGLASSDGNWVVSRFDTDGSRDTTFNAPGTLDRNQDVLVQSDGKIVSLGSSYSTSSGALSDIFLGRYLP